MLVFKTFFFFLKKNQINTIEVQFKVFSISVFFLLVDFLSRLPVNFRRNMFYNEIKKLKYQSKKV